MAAPGRMFIVPAALEEALFQHFMCQKMEIAYAIHKPFPFFEGLRDNSFITDRVLADSVEECRRLVPVSRVVYDVLTRLEQTFTPALLGTLFSHINLCEYPRLAAVLTSFRRVCTSYGEWHPRPAIPLEAPPGPTEGSCPQTLLLPLPQPPPQGQLPSASRVGDLGVSSPSSSDTSVLQPVHILEGRKKPVTNANLISERDEQEDPQRLPSPPLDTAQVKREDSPEPDDPEDSQEVPCPSPRKGTKKKRSIWSTPKKRRQKKRLPREEKRKRASCSNSRQEETKTPGGAVSSGHGMQKKLEQVARRQGDPIQNSGVMTRNKKAKMNCTRVSRLEEKKQKANTRARSKRIQKNILQRENHEDDTVDFRCPKLPVTCGKAKGILYKKKMRQGSLEKCIQNGKGAWFTPSEFAAEGKRGGKNWKRDIRCGEKSLRELLEEGLLLCPPGRCLKRGGRAGEFLPHLSEGLRVPKLTSSK
ncbi:sp110 nuclear body protein-like isoform X1 [Ochotona curzoniae]|uniref:sp110 nuclear body protein-like isoform X1 n=2 Tax=Ochotona curzoniae TaxID=130825 RepID=UPI001B349A16|nr:sp110 nuclear body protein-like isoform X1 [Ochotona curzoniae]XP_040838796.1 sp110 nuclear body protein-like isoform X1 [Ochotona curzoniae]XP_040838802.1 sp110 nuclear body protein-like isoform X1 [Ochotona curzoniae]